jgi:hypothetical protein
MNFTVMIPLAAAQPLRSKHLTWPGSVIPVMEERKRENREKLHLEFRA